MRKLITPLIVLFVVIPFAAVAQASGNQSYPKAEIFGGYNFTYLNSDANMDGFNAAVTGNFSPSFGITTEISGVFGKEKTSTILNTRANMYSFMAGPQFTKRRGSIAFNGHFLAGIMRIGAGVDFLGARLNVAEEHFIMAIGSGLDLGRPESRIGVRLFQLDYLPIAAEGWSNHVRISAGVLIRIGK